MNGLVDERDKMTEVEMSIRHVDGEAHIAITGANVISTEMLNEIKEKIDVSFMFFGADKVEISGTLRREFKEFNMLES